MIIIIIIIIIINLKTYNRRIALLLAAIILLEVSVTMAADDILNVFVLLSEQIRFDILYELSVI